MALNHSSEFNVILLVEYVIGRLKGSYLQTLRSEQFPKHYAKYKGEEVKYGLGPKQPTGF